MSDKLDLTDTLNNFSYHWLANYKPTVFAINFINFIKLVNDGKGEENLSPVYHYHILDQLTKYEHNLFIAFRGSGKSTLLGEYLLLYLATFNKLPLIGEVPLAIYISDTIENGVKSLRNNLESRYDRSEFLQRHVPKAKFTDTRCEFENSKGKKFIYRAFGAASGIRGVKEQGIRPSLCHKKGTVVTTDLGTHKVEEYYKTGEERVEKGYNIKLYGLDLVETVTKEHRYKTLKNEWIEAKDIVKNKTILVKKINMTETKVPKVFRKEVCVPNGNFVETQEIVHTNMFWYFYGYYLACGNFCNYMTVSFHGKYVTPDLLELLNKMGIVPKVSNGYWLVNVGFQKYYSGVREIFKNIYLEHWIKELDLIKQKQMLDGFIDGQNLTNKKYNALLLHNLGCIAERLGYMYNTLGQRLSLVTDNSEHLYRDNNYVYRMVESVEESEEEVFVPIQTPSHEYSTPFGISHNCIIDDILSDKNADSPTIIEDINNTVYAASDFAMHPKHQTIWIGTPFNKKDPLYTAYGTEMWNSNVYPIAESFPCDVQEFRGAWTDRFSYDFIAKKFSNLQSVGRLDAFNKEFMLRIMSDEDRLVLEDDIIFTEDVDYYMSKEKYSFYITTDIAVSEKQKADFSVICVWCYDREGNWVLVDGMIDRVKINIFIDRLFEYVSEYEVSAVVMEKSATQKGFIDLIENEMIKRQEYFYLARDKGSSEAGFLMSTSKLARFNKILPLFKVKKIKFHSFIKRRLLDKEGLDELRSITYSGIKSKHDDFVDTVSQLSYILPYMKEIDEESKKEVKKRVDNSVYNIYTESDYSETKGSLKDYL